MQEFVKALQRIDEAIQSWQKRNSDRYSHLEKNDIDKVYKILVEKQKWYDQTANRFKTLRLHEDPAVLCSQLKQEKEVEYFVENEILTMIVTFCFFFQDIGTRMLDDFK